MKSDLEEEKRLADSKKNKILKAVFRHVFSESSLLIQNILQLFDFDKSYQSLLLLKAIF